MGIFFQLDTLMNYILWNANIINIFNSEFTNRVSNAKKNYNRTVEFIQNPKAN